ncbi:hypothetical protein B0H11DRAFT_2007785, partial [Mycena galericulata]
MDDCEYVVQGGAEERMSLHIPPRDTVVIWGIAPRSPATTTLMQYSITGWRNPGLVLGSTCSSSGIRRPARTSRATYQERCDMYGTRCAPQVHAACLLDLIFLFRLSLVNADRSSLATHGHASTWTYTPRAVVLPPSRAPQVTHTLHLRTTGPGSALSLVAGSAAVRTASIWTGRKAEDTFDETEADRAVDDYTPRLRRWNVMSFSRAIGGLTRGGVD